MKKQLQKFFAKKKNNKGFTLIELIVVIAILAILIGIIGVASVRYVEKSRESTDAALLDSISTAAQAAVVDPANGVTVSSGANISVNVKTNGGVDITDITLTGFNYSSDSGFSDEKLKQSIIDDLSKEPVFRSQKYIGKTTKLVFGSNGKVENWSDPSK